MNKILSCIIISIIIFFGCQANQNKPFVKKHYSEAEVFAVDSFVDQIPHSESEFYLAEKNTISGLKSSQYISEFSADPLAKTIRNADIRWRKEIQSPWYIMRHTVLEKTNKDGVYNVHVVGNIVLTRHELKRIYNKNDHYDYKKGFWKFDRYGGEINVNNKSEEQIERELAHIIHH